MLSNLTVATELFHATDETAFADIMMEGHRETWPIRSSRFRLWLRRKYYESTGEAPSAGEVNSALNLLEARAQFDGPERAVHIRVAEHDGRVYLDLADEHWRAVEIDADGWRVVSCPPVRFRRAAGMLPLPVPAEGGSIEALASFCNISSRSDFVLVISWLLAGLRQGGPYPILALSGEQGSAKTVLSKMLRALMDPNVAPVRSAPREERDLFIAASNGHLLAFDNLSDLPAWTSDALCRLASGGSFATRRLYTNQDEMLFQAARPIVLNGIEDVITRPDLADRTIFVALPFVPDHRRRPEAQIWGAFEAARPQILGALLGAVAHGLSVVSDVRLEQLPRMADFAVWSTACEPAFSVAGSFSHAYRANRRVAIEDVVEADPVAARIRDLMAQRSQWAGSASDLLHMGTADMARGELGWPKSPRALAGCLRRAQTPLRALGIEMTFGRAGHAGTRVITLRAPRPYRDATVSTVSAAE